MSKPTNAGLAVALTANERARLAARSACALDTIRRYPDVREASRLRIERAAREEGIELPPAPAATRAA